MNIHIIAGARPNFMKIAPVVEAIKKAAQSGKNISYRLIHTGQHYDEKMSHAFFRELGIPEPDVNLEVGSGTQAEQTGNIMVKYEKELLANPCQAVLVVGDVNSTMACTLVAKKLNTPVVHVEAGIRSYDMTMPEEINRLVTDAIADHFYTTTEIAGDNLLKSGITKDRIHFVGNTMIDTLLRNINRLQQPDWFTAKGLKEKEYLVLTLHRPSNVDDAANLSAMMQEILGNSGDKKIVFPVHPRTLKNLPESLSSNERLILIDPLPYLSFIYLVKNAYGVLTDSGGIQEETTVLGVPCITFRDNTERPETVSIGTNELVGASVKNVKPALNKLMAGSWKKGSIPPLWDGKTAERIVESLLKIYSL